MLNTPLMAQVERSGFVAPEAIVHLFIGGSELHGAKVGKTDDLDIYGVFIGRPNDVLGLDPLEHFVWSTATDDRRNGPDDVDVTLYSLEKWARMAARGNATALHFLFADATAVSDPVWGIIQAQVRLFLSKRSSIQFLGFADNQFRRITGEMGQGVKGRRPEYECKHGYDSKAAMHCLRLYFECIELMRHGEITLPRPEREYLVRIREGALSLEEFRAEAARLKLEAEQAAEYSLLPDECNREAISTVVALAHLRYWKNVGQL
jgi:predicted nucleotidyltransferase